MEQDEACLAEAEERFEAGDLEGAEGLLRRIGVTSPLCRDALLGLSRVMVAGRHLEEALRCAEEADNLDRDGLSCYQMAVCHAAVRDWPMAFEQVERALQLAPEHAPSHGLRADLAFQRNEAVEAVASYARAIALGDQRALAFHRLGKCYVALHDAVQGCKAFDRAIRVDSTQWQSYLEAAALCELYGWFARARGYFETLTGVPDHHVMASGAIARLDQEISRRGRASDPPGGPDSSQAYLHGPFLAARPQAPAARTVEQPPAPATPAPPASNVTRPLTTPPTAIRPSPPSPLSRAGTRPLSGSGMLESLQQKLREKLREADGSEPPETP